MGVNVGTAWVTLAASGKGISGSIQKELKGAGTKAGQQFGTEFDKSAAKSTTSLESFGTKALVGAAAVGAAFFGLASAAGDLSAAVAANEQVLGDASQAVQDFAETGVESVGLSETAILSAATSFGQLGKVIGLTGADLSTFSTDLVTLASDMAAFKNVTPTQALEDLQSAFAGQPEVLRKYGVFLDDVTLKQAYFEQTGERVSGTLTAQQRLIATNAELWRQTGDIQGQAAREADGFERSIANLKATVSNAAADFGAPIVGFASELLSAITGGIGTLESWNLQTGGMLATGLAAGIGIAGAGGAALGIVSKVGSAVEKFKALGKWTKIATGAVGGLALAVTAGFVIYGMLTKESRELQARTKEVSDALSEATTEAWEYVEATTGATENVDGFAVAQRALSTALTTTGDDGEALTQALGALGLQSEDAFATLLSIGREGGPQAQAALESVAEAAGHSGIELDILADAVNSVDDNGDLRLRLEEIAMGLGASEVEATALADSLLPTARNMEELQDQAEKTDLGKLAQQFLDTASATNEDAEALVDEAEARAASNEVADSSVDTYTELMGIIGEMGSEERAAALEALGLADASTEAARASEELTGVAADTIDTTSDLADAFDKAAGDADTLSSALDMLIGRGLEVGEAQRQLEEGLDTLTETLIENGDQWDINSDAGRANGAALSDSVSNVLELADAQIRAGATTEEATVEMLRQRDVLINEVAVALGITTEEAAEYVNQLGLTPTAVNTAIELANAEQAKAEVQEHLDKLGEIPEDLATEIETLMNEGEYQAVLNKLIALEKVRYVDLFIREHGVTRSGPGLSPEAVAYGGYFPGNHLTPLWAGDAPWDEAMLTVGNMANLRRQLQDERIAGPILEALPQVEPIGGGGGGGRRGRGDVNVISYEQNPTPAGVAAALRMAGVS